MKIIASVLELLALAFTAFISAGLLLFTNLNGLKDECIKEDTCDIWEVCFTGWIRIVLCVVLLSMGHDVSPQVLIVRYPFERGLTTWMVCGLMYLSVCVFICLLSLVG